MARARNIKPAFFTSEQIADQCPMGRLLFIGLWTLADFKGELEFKERTIKVQVLPFDDCSIKDLAIKLDRSGLIRFYAVGDSLFINIPNFERHQNPHKNEKLKGSDIPEFSIKARQLVDLKTLKINRSESRAKPNENGTHLADSLNLIPDSGFPNPEPPAAQFVLAEAFEELWSSWPKGFGEKGSKEKAEAEYLKLKPDKPLHEKLMFALSAQAIDKSRKQANNAFFSNFPHVLRWIKDKRWTDEIAGHTARQGKLSKSDEADRAYQEQLARITGGNPERNAGFEGDGPDYLLAEQH
jgi:hypothetical protein